MRHSNARNTPIGFKLLSLAACFLLGNVAYAESAKDLVKQAVTEYRAGDYSNSAGHFYALLTTDFNNPRIHYYLASCYAHMNDTESAVREFRIAYALAPQTDVGYFASKALKYYGVNSKDSSLKTLMDDSLRSSPKGPTDAGAGTTAPGLAPTGPTGPTGAGAGAGTGAAAPFTFPPPPAAPSVLAPPSTADQSISLIKSQLEKAKSVKLGESQHLADQLSSQRDERMDRAVSTIGGRLSSDPKQREREILMMPDDVRSLLEMLRRDYDGKSNRQLGEQRRQSDALEESANNLKDLIEKDQSIEAAGSNLYVRNYKKKPAGNSAK